MLGKQASWDQPIASPRILEQGINMNATNVLERVPIHTDAEGVVRVAGTRVTLESVVDAFETGAVAEEQADDHAGTETGNGPLGEGHGSLERS